MTTVNRTRAKRPYEKKTVSKGGALLFGLGLGAMLAVIGVLLFAASPALSRRLENLPYYARTYYRKLIPHPEYLPTPAPTVSAPVTPPPQALALDLSAAIDPTPAAHAAAEDTLPQPQATPAPVLLAPVTGQVQLNGFTHQWQTWNNCGPATVTTNMSYFGRTETQADAAQLLKPNRDDKNVSPYELAAYARSTGLEAIVRQGGTVDQLKMFLSNGLPVLAETWLIHDGDGLGHYRLVIGYNDATGQFDTFDTLNGPHFKVDYNRFEADWRVFNSLYLIVYPPEQAQTVAAIIGEDMDDARMYSRILAQAQAEAAANPNDAIAYFNQGEVLTRLGRFQEATAAFDRARAIGLHWRRLWYQFTPFEAYYATGRFQDVLDLTEATLEGTGGLEEAYYYRGLALLATGQPGAEEAFQAALEYNPLFTPAADALNRLIESN